MLFPSKLGSGFRTLDSDVDPCWIQLDSGIQLGSTPQTRNSDAQSKAYAVWLRAGLQGGFPKNSPDH